MFRLILMEGKSPPQPQIFLYLQACHVFSLIHLLLKKMIVTACNNHHYSGDRAIFQVVCPCHIMFSQIPKKGQAHYFLITLMWCSCSSWCCLFTNVHITITCSIPIAWNLNKKINKKFAFAIKQKCAFCESFKGHAHKNPTSELFFRSSDIL